MLVDLPGIKSYLDVDHSRDDERLTIIGEGLTALFEDRTGLSFTAQNLDETYNANACIHLETHPVTTVTQVYYDPKRAFTSDTLLGTDEWMLNKNAGLLYISKPLGRYPQSIRVQYTSGYINVPDDWKRLFLAQLQHEWQNRDKMGIKTITDSVGGSVSMVGYELLPQVAKTIKTFSRVVL